MWRGGEDLRLSPSFPFSLLLPNVYFTHVDTLVSCKRLFLRRSERFLNLTYWLGLKTTLAWSGDRSVKINKRSTERREKVLRWPEKSHRSSPLPLNKLVSSYIWDIRDKIILKWLTNGSRSVTINFSYIKWISRFLSNSRMIHGPVPGGFSLVSSVCLPGRTSTVRSPLGLLLLLSLLCTCRGVFVVILSCKNFPLPFSSLSLKT